MSCAPALSKLEELRLRTDRELLQLIERESEVGIRLACAALNAPEAAGHLRAGASRSLEEMVRLSRLLRNASGQDRRTVEGRVAKLRALVEESSAPERRGVEAVAHALWRARGCAEGSPEQDWYRAERLVASGRA